jgi:hypothetical protein
MTSPLNILSLIPDIAEREREAEEQLQRLGFVRYEPYREVRIQLGSDPLDLTKLHPTVLRGAMSLTISANEMSEFSFTIADVNRQLLRDSRVEGVPEMYGHVVQFYGGYATPPDAHRHMFTGFINKITPIWKPNGEIHLSFRCRGSMFRMSRVRYGRRSYPRTAELAYKEEALKAIAELGADTPIIQEWAVTDKLSVYDIVTNIVEGYGFTADVDDTYKGDEFTYTSKPDPESGAAANPKVQLNQSDWAFLQALARDPEISGVLTEDGATVSFHRADTLLDKPERTNLGFVWHSPNPRAGTISFVDPSTFDPRRPTLMPVTSVSGDIDVLQMAAKAGAQFEISENGEVLIFLREREFHDRPNRQFRTLTGVDQERFDAAQEELGLLGVGREGTEALVLGDQQSVDFIRSLLQYDVGQRIARRPGEPIPLRLKPNWKINVSTIGTVYAFPGKVYPIHNLADFLEGAGWMCTSVTHTFERSFKTSVQLGWIGRDGESVEE